MIRDLEESWQQVHCPAKAKYSTRTALARKPFREAHRKIFRKWRQGQPDTPIVLQFSLPASMTRCYSSRTNRDGVHITPSEPLH